ncbi:MAG: hypothetical protein R3B13_19620 [Polyangiaceae bacterium]
MSTLSCSEEFQGGGDSGGSAGASGSSTGGASGSGSASSGGASGSGGASSGGASGSGGASSGGASSGGTSSGGASSGGASSGGASSGGSGGGPPALVPKTAAQGLLHGCAVRLDGGVECWGDNTYGQLGRGNKGGSANTAADVKTANGALSNAKSIAAGVGHSCALSGSDVYCWGSNASGELLPGGGASSNVAILALSGATDVATGDIHTCAALATNGVKCWGSGALGQLGPSGGALQGKKIYALEAGGFNTCAITDTVPRGLYCWGVNDTKQLTSAASGAHTATPTLIAVTNPSHVAIGLNHACAIDGSSKLWCWGLNVAGQVGNGDGGPGKIVATPTQVNLTGQVVDVEAGRDHTCALVGGTAAPSLYCWGGNGQSQLGKTGSGVDLPVLVSGLDSIAGIVDLATMDNNTTCVRTVSGEVYCWGANGLGQVGNGSTGTGVSVPAKVSGLP